MISGKIQFQMSKQLIGLTVLLLFSERYMSDFFRMSNLLFKNLYLRKSLTILHHLQLFFSNTCFTRFLKITQFALLAFSHAAINLSISFFQGWIMCSPNITRTHEEPKQGDHEEKCYLPFRPFMFIVSKKYSLGRKSGMLFRQKEWPQLLKSETITLGEILRYDKAIAEGSC